MLYRRTIHTIHVIDDNLRLRMNNQGSWLGGLPNCCASFCGALIRITLLLVLIVNVGITSTLVVRFTTINGIQIDGATPPASVIFSEVIGTVSLAYVLLSFCFMGLPLILLFGDTVCFVGWFAASIILGNSMNQTLRFNCQDLAITLASRAGAVGLNAGFNSNFGFGNNPLAQQIFDSCNLSKTLFSFHIIATVAFIAVAINAAVAASFGRKRKAPRVNQQTNYYNGNQAVYSSNRGMRSGPAPAVPEIVV